MITTNDVRSDLETAHRLVKESKVRKLSQVEILFLGMFKVLLLVYEKECEKWDKWPAAAATGTVIVAINRAMGLE